MYTSWRFRSAERPDRVGVRAPRWFPELRAEPRFDTGRRVG